MRLLLAQLNPTVGDIQGNCEKILVTLDYARSIEADGVLFSEMCIPGYLAEDLLLLPHFLDAVESALQVIIPKTQDLFAIIGTVRRSGEGSSKHIHNTAAIVENGTLIGFHDKILLPTYDVFDEARYFEPGKEVQIWTLGGKRMAVTICEDIWGYADSVAHTQYQQDPVESLHGQDFDFVLNVSSSPFEAGKTELRAHVCSVCAAGLGRPVFQCNQVGGNDSLIFDGHSLWLGADGELRAIAEGFKEDLLLVDTSEDASPVDWQLDETECLYQSLVLGVRDYFGKLGFKKACLGLSGGVDSALVACIAAEALGAENVLCVMMPSRYTSKASFEDAYQLIETLGVEQMEIPIEEPFESFLGQLQPHFVGKAEDATEENLQSRIRGVLLMALSNKLGHVVLSTGNKSEMAMGYSTLYGDTVGGLAVINDLTKEQVYELCRWINRDKIVIPENILTKAPSAELRPDQKDTDTLPEYSVVDTVLQEYVEEHRSAESISERHGFDLALVKDLITRVHRNEYKRRQGAIGLRVTKKAFSIGRRFPIVQRWR